MRRGLALGVALALLTTALASACGSDEAEDPRFLDDGSFRPDTGSDARVDRYVSCDPSDSTCNDAASDAPAEANEGGLCPPTNTCTGARDLGKASGDTGSDLLNASGSKSEWLSVRVTEDSNGIPNLKVKISLSSPAGSNFDLFVYYDQLADKVKCTAPASASSTQQAGISDSASLFWPDAFGSDDSRTVSIEVRHVSGTCNPGDRWTLIIQGNE